ncbi:ABC transporter ATP-binding protein [Vibrio nigripulchritudo]|uniref:ABC transporter ATP-binding protein n=1 Tax=Vibrio nigripulchritudo TaxID=28173 RepID=UPI0003B20B04|nr:ABC transporter ATP-binding protein [Vibrio nigripulchritudo]CCN70285.1 ABC transporter related protein [Vibrio nigripulchritudo SFn118]
MIENNNIAVSVKGLSKVYRLYSRPKDRVKELISFKEKKLHKEHHALSNVSLDIRKGEIIGLIGKNGAGKSTLLKVITGIVTPTSGEWALNGRVASLLELGAGFNMDLSGLENIYLNGTIMGFTRDEVDKKLDNIINFADIGDFIHQPVKMYSSGMFARLAFSVAINVDPDILIIDEALSVGDMKFQLKCMDKFNEFRESGKTIIFVSHDINAIKRFCTYCIWIKNGSVQDEGNTDVVTDSYIDYLRMDDTNNTEIDRNNLKEDVAKIVNVVTRRKGNLEDVEKFNYLDDIEVEVEYEVFDEKISDPVLGVSLNTLDNKNISGLNTLLDKVNIPWEIGNNKFKLLYSNLTLVGGSYRVDVALFEKNATVSFDYKLGIKHITISTPYVGEGVFIPHHTWSK